MSFIVSTKPTPAGSTTGPGSSTDNAVARWNGTSGTSIQNSGVIIDDSDAITGVTSLTVTTLIATNTITTGDNLIVLNDDVAGAPSEDAGIEVNRGASTDAHLLWDETNDYWAAGLAGSTAQILLAGADHGLLSGLSDDDHTIYHTNARALTWLGTRSTSDLPEGSNLYFTDEKAQDAVGTILTDSASIDFTYNDAGASITAAVLPAGVDHNSLSNFSANKHVDHTAVVLTAGVALSGGGDISASRTFDLEDTAVSPNSYGSATQVATFTVDQQGRLTAAGNSTIAVTSSAISDFNEAAQDAVGGALADSASVDFTYTDGSNSITAAVLPAGVDHNSLSNFVANKHIDHTAVTLTAGTGLSGGGDISASRTFNLANTAVTPTSYGSATQVAGFTVDQQGRLTAASNTSIAITSSAVTDFTEAAQDAVGGALTDTAEIDFTYTDGSNQITADLKTTTVSANSYGSASAVGTFTVDTKGRLTTAATTNIAVTSAAVSDFTEAAQDAVGAALTDTASVDFTYSDAGNTISAAVLPAGVDHNSLSNFVANKHIDHTAVTLTAGTGLSGGGDISASRTFNLADTAVSAASYGSATQVPGYTVDAQGRLTAASNTSIQIAESQVTNLTTDLAAKQALDATLTALAAYNTNGLLTQTAADTFTGRTVTGTSNRISVSNGNGVSGNPTVDIDSAYVGQATITTLGTITTGVWTGTDVAVADGGTGVSSLTAYAVLCGGTTSTGAVQAIASVGSAGQYLLSNGAGALPTMQTPPWAFGDGADGDVTINSGTTTLTRDMFYNNLTISSTGKLSCNAYRVFVKGTLDLTAAGASAMNANGNTGTNGVSSASGGAGSVGGTGLLTGTVGSSGNDGATGGSSSTTVGAVGGNATTFGIAGGGPSGAGGTGGAGTGGAGGTGGTGNASTAARIQLHRYIETPTRGTSLIQGGINGAGGGGGGGGGAAVGAGGGGGGGGAGFVYIAAAKILTTGAAASAISAIGGTAGTGGAATGSTRGGGGGGSGGGGGQIYIYYGIKGDAAATNVLDASGGTGGGGGNGTQAGGNGGAGGGGGGISYFNILTGAGSDTFGGNTQAGNAAVTTTGGATKAGESLKVNF